MADSLVCHANHVLSVAAIRKAHLSTAGMDPCYRCVSFCECKHVGGSGSLCVCEHVKGLHFLRQCCFYVFWGKKENKQTNKKIRPVWFFEFMIVAQIWGRCVRAAEGRVPCCDLSVGTVWLAWWVLAIPSHPQSNQTTIIWDTQTWHKHRCAEIQCRHT